MEQVQKQQRRFDVDWLRTLAFMLLILYHVGMYYVAEWDWHIKSVHQSEWLQNLMILSNQWRMCLLFFVSGMTLFLIKNNYTSGRLLSVRSKRLLVPLIFGMLIICAPQLYYELLEKDAYNGSFSTFWLEYIDLNTTLAPEKQSVLGLLTWNHLWYLPYLFVYTLAFLLIKPLLERLTRSRFYHRLPVWMFVLIIIVVLLAVWFTMRLKFPSNHSLVGDWYNHGKYFSVFIFGYLFAASVRTWNTVIEKRRWILLLAVSTYTFVIMDREGFFPALAEMFTTSDWVRLGYGIVFVTNLWCWLLVCVGYAGRYLQFTNGFLRYANHAVLCWYILHQTLIIVIAANLAPLNLHVGLEVSLIIGGTALGCLLGYEIVKRFAPLRFLFGLKMQA